MADSSFDIVSKVDHQEADNALQQARKEVEQRYDFKGTGASVEWSGEAILIKASTEERVLESIDLGEAGAVLASLSPELMEVVQAMVFDGLTAKETGRMLGVPEGTVKGRMRKAKSNAEFLMSMNLS